MRPTAFVVLLIASSLAQPTAAQDAPTSTDEILLPPPPGAELAPAADAEILPPPPEEILPPPPQEVPLPPAEIIPLAEAGSAPPIAPRGSHWEWGPSLEHMAGSLVLFGVGYLVQVLSTAVSAAQGEHDIGLTYTAPQLEEYRSWGYLPLVGPWAKVVLAPPHVDDYGSALFALEGLIELGALVYFVVSLFGEVRDDPAVPGSFRITPRATGLSFDLVF